MATNKNKHMKIGRSGSFGIALAWLALSITAPKGARAEGSPTSNNNGPETEAKPRINKSPIKDLGGKLLLDAYVEITQPLQIDKKINFVSLSTPTTTPSSGHAELWLNNGSKQLCTIFDDGSSGCLASSSGVFLTESSATATYLQLSSASATYLQQSSATATYLQQSSATLTYLTKSSAAVTYCNSNGTNCTASGPTLVATQTWSGQNTWASPKQSTFTYQLVVGSISFVSYTVGGLIGTTTNNAAPAGTVGEYVESVVSGVAAPTSAQWGDLTSISLTAGDWDVTVCDQGNEGATWTDHELGISQTTGNSATGLVNGSNKLILDTVSGSVVKGACIASYRQSLSGTTTIYAKSFNVFSVSLTFAARLSARRVR